MAQIPFSVSARTARLIGRENVSNAEGAVIELVKNSYDADSEVSIVLIDKPNDTILIIDAGEGMNDSVIREQWMTIGTDNKLNDAFTASGRVRAGAKGIGRFALDRLGEQCTMITFPINNNLGYRWVVNWSDFNQKIEGRNIKINEVYADLNTVEKSSFKEEIAEEVNNHEVNTIIAKYGFTNGTLLKITGLRDEWRGNSINEVFESLELLTPPEGANNIEMYFFDGAAPGKYGAVLNMPFTDYDYKIIASYKKNANHQLTIDVHRNEFDFGLIDERLFDLPDMKVFPYDKETFKKEYYQIEKSLKEILKSNDDKIMALDKIGDFVFTFYFLKNTIKKNDRDKFKYKEIRGDRTLWLKRYGGIKLYRDNFRVRPYGEPGTPAYDWLMLGERFSQNPVAFTRKGSRVRPNQIAGVLKFSRIENPYLEDKSSREGLQENDTLELFKNILKGIIKIQEDDRSTVGFNLNELNKIIFEDEKSIEDSENIVIEFDNENNDVSNEKFITLKKGFIAIQAKLKEKEEELTISRAMAGAGIMIASFSHEFHGIKNDLKSRVNNLKKFLENVIDHDKLKNVPDRKNPLKLIDDFKNQDDKIRQWIEFSVELTKKDRRKDKNVELKKYFNSIYPLWGKIFDERGISLFVQADEALVFSVKISELDLDTIFDNLMINSVEAFDRNEFSGPKEIYIDMKYHENWILVKYRDTGPGIPLTYKNINDIFIPFETSKMDDIGNEIGTGLGMWLVKTSIDSNKGKAELKRPESGFEIDIYFKTNLNTNG